MNFQPNEIITPPVLTQPSKKISFTFYIISLIVVSLVSVGGTFYWQKGNQKEAILPSNQDSKVTSNTSTNIYPTIEQIATPTKSVGSLPEIESIFKKISDGSIIFNEKRDSVVFYQNRDDLSKLTPGESRPVDLIVNIYKYQPGAKFNNGYEGVDHIIDLDQWKSWLQSLKPGESQPKTICNDFGCNRPNNAQVLVKNINENKYIIIDDFFLPGGNYTRHYTRFDTKNNQFIDITISFYLDKGSPEMINVFSTIESSLP